MDKLSRYRDLIKQNLCERATLMRSQPVEGVDTLYIVDEMSDQYVLCSVGWHDGKRVRYTTLHVRICQDKIWVEEDWTEEGIATDLVAAGVPKEDIVLAFTPPELRHLTEYAVV